LKNAGINCFLLDEFTSTINPILGNIIGGIKLVVDEKDANKASDLLKQFHDEFMKTATCPTCGLHEITLVSANTAANFFTKIFTWIFSSHAVSVESIYQCQSCGYESKTLPDVDNKEFAVG
jgi:predicted RNA-binding Zn-ribbon protein involved in translation (DUF1610 family)